jgi:hypothetical protein
VADVNNPPARYARRNTVRVDVLENVKDGTVCVYDIKTGERTLLPVRMEEIARSVYLPKCPAFHRYRSQTKALTDA